MKKNLLVITILSIVIVALGALLLLPKTSNNNQNNNVPQGNDGIEITLPKSGDTLSSPVKITGMVKGNGWTGFEGQVGVVKLFDADNSQLALGILTATADWMTLPTQFETTLFFDYSGEGEGKLVFYNENASGEPARDKTFTLPVKLTTSSSKTTTVKVYFSGDAQDCEKVYAQDRVLPHTEAPAKAALEALLAGPSDQEKNAGLFTNINPGVKIQSLVIENGTAKVDFSSELNDGVAGSCRVTAIRAQIEQTLKQFPTVQSVIISVNGDNETILQP